MSRYLLLYRLGYLAVILVPRGDILMITKTYRVTRVYLHCASVKEIVVITRLYRGTWFTPTLCLQYTLSVV